MGRGRSALTKGGSGKNPQAGKIPDDYPEAFQPGKDYEAVGGVNHTTRTVSRTTQAEWDQFAGTMQNGVTAQDYNMLDRKYSMTPNGLGDNVVGYVRTRNAFFINQELYDPKNAGKTDAQIFKRKADRDTVKTLDRAINNNSIPANGSYFRFSSPGGIKGAFNLSDSEVQLLQAAHTMTPAQIKQLNKAFVGRSSYSKAFTSTSANRTLNAFKDPTAKQSKGFTFERKINMPKGTKAFAPKSNAQESEVIFGRGLKTKIVGISVAKDGHIVIHEAFDGYQ